MEKGQNHQYSKLDDLWYGSKVPLLGCLIHTDVETGAFVRGDVVIIHYRCIECGKSTTVEAVL